MSYLSYSQVRAYLDCPCFYKFRYLKKVPAVITARQIAGRVYDHGVSYALKRRQAGEIVSSDEVKDIMSDRWQFETREPVDYEDSGEVQVEAKNIEWGEDEPGKLKDVVLKLGDIYIKTMLPMMQPIAVQERLTGVLGGVPFIGYPDVIVGQSLDAAGVGIIDHKFTTRRANQEMINKDMQFSAYAALLDRPVWAAWHQALDQKKLAINVVTTERNRGDIGWFNHLVAEVWKGIQASIFPPNPLCWRCGSRCPYELECRILMEV